MNFSASLFRLRFMQNATLPDDKSSFAVSPELQMPVIIAAVSETRLNICKPSP